MFAIIGLIAFIIAGILHLVGKDGGAVTWLIVAGGICYGIHLLWEWRAAPWRRGQPPVS
jgi:hypothetical protein